jgi:hypothetical protein
MNARGIAGFALCIVGVVCATVAVISPWYVISIDGTGLLTWGSGEYDLYSDHYTHSSSNKMETYNYSSFPRTASVVSTATYMTDISIVFGMICLILIILAIMHRIKGPIAGFLILLLSIMIILAPILYMMSLPDALKSDLQGNNLPIFCDSFSGTKSESTWLYKYTSTCGPGNGWIAMIISFILIFISGLIAVRIAPPSPVIVTVPPAYYSTHVSDSGP